MTMPVNLDPMVNYRATPAPDLGTDARVDALAYAVCSNGGHIPNFRPSRPEMACDFHRRMALAYIRVVENAAGDR